MRSQEDFRNQATFQRRYSDETKKRANKNGVYAVLINGVNYQNVKTTVKWCDLEGFEFQFPTTQTILIYRDGACYGIAPAYEQGKVSDTWLLDLYYNQYRFYVWQMTDWTWIRIDPQPK